MDVINKNDCTGCMACMNICPRKAINIYEDNEGFKFPKINQDLCINCGLCKKVCPVINKMEENTYNIKAYACKNKNLESRLKSSSGGVFILLAKYIIKNEGVVFGARFNEKLEVIHDYTDKEENIKLFMGSKYVQSNINDSYKKAKKFLLENKLVLFTGTPCQIEGLLKYLGKDYENLYTQDIICHGVPSPKLWKKYLEYLKEKNGKIPKTVNFRRKDIAGWNNYQVNYIYDKNEENVHHNDDIYMNLFLENIALRNSCYHCKFKKTARKSDITIADFWGIDNIHPKINDEKGISAVLINSQKGERLFKSIKNDIEYYNADITSIEKYNPCLNHAVTYNEKRKDFFYDLDYINFDELIEKYIK